MPDKILQACQQLMPIVHGKAVRSADLFKDRMQPVHTQALSGRQMSCSLLDDPHCPHAAKHLILLKFAVMHCRTVSHDANC